MFEHSCTVLVLNWKNLTVQPPIKDTPNKGRTHFEVPNIRFPITLVYFNLELCKMPCIHVIIIQILLMKISVDLISGDGGDK